MVLITKKKLFLLNNGEKSCPFWGWLFVYLLKNKNYDYKWGYSMKKINKMIFTLIGGMFFACSTTFHVNADWKTEDEKWWYATENGYKTGWEYIAGKWYYFDESGWMQTGWQQIDGKWYYLKDSGEMMTGWKEIDGQNNWYYFENSGAMRTEDLAENGVIYHFDSSGKCVNPTEEQQAQVKTTPTIPTKYSLGTWNGNVFSSELLNLSFTFPNDVTRISLYDLKELGMNMDVIDLFNDGATSAQENLEDYETAIDFALILDDEYSNMELLWENITGFEITESDYLEVFKQSDYMYVLQFLGAPIKYMKEETVQIGGQTFLKLSICFNDMGYQDIYVIKKGNFMGVMLVTYSLESADIVQGILDSATAIIK